MGWIGKKRPKMIAVQAAGCAPIPKAFKEGRSASEMWEAAVTFAAGLRVPKAYGDYIVLDIVRKSGGVAVAVTDAEMMDSILEWSRDEALFASPEGAASLAAYKKLLADGTLSAKDKVVLFNTGLGLKYIDVVAQAMGIGGTANGAGVGAAKTTPASRNIGGIIGPY